MLRRWTIRSLFIALLLLCIGMWVWSYLCCDYGEYRSRNTSPRFLERALSISSNRGQLVLAMTTFCDLLPGMHALPSGCHHYVRHANSDPTDEWFEWSGYTPPIRLFAFLGFGFAYAVADDEPALGLSPTTYLSQYRLFLPLWFPTTISAVLLLLVWRKTRPPVKGRAFPVELAKPIAEPGGKAG